MIYSELNSLIAHSKRPIFIWGAGIRPYADEAREIAENWTIPVVCTWGAIDLLDAYHPLMAGGFGTHGTRAANFAVQNADLVISIGSRLDTKATGQPEHFARAAKIIMVDIDEAELLKFEKLGRRIDMPLQMDCGEFLKHLSEQTFGNYWHDTWVRRIQEWKLRYAMPKVDWPGVNPYQLMQAIAEHTTKEDIICTDTGFALGWTMQAFPFKGERFIHAFNMTPMGYGLPAAIGAAFATGRRVVLITGDGSIMMSLPELATIKRWNLPIKIVLLNNDGHGMCRQTQRQWLGGRYHATSIQGGLGFPNWDDCFKSFGIVECFDLVDLFREQRPSFFEVPIDPDAQLVPQAKYSQPIEDADPQLPWEELCEQMIIPPLERPKI
jgi:acetolactate synthase-1/2/3 large subunit